MNLRLRLSPRARRAISNLEIVEKLHAPDSDGVGALPASTLAVWQVLDSLRTGVAILDQHGRVMFANEPLRRISARRDGLVLQDDRLGCVDRAAGVTLAASLGPCERAQRFSARRGGGRAPYQLTVLQLPRVSTPFVCRLPNTAVLVTDPEAPEQISSEFDRRFRLTKSESAVLDALLRGETLRANAERTQRSVHTVRALLKRVLAKTGTHSQAQLVRAAMEHAVLGLVLR